MISHSCRKQTRSTKPVSAGFSLKERRELELMKQNEVAYKSKIRSLEVELDTLKCRLDTLRKAKNTTIVRREREHVRVSSPKLGRRHSALSSPINSCPSTAIVSPQETMPIRTCHHGNLLNQLEDLRKQVDCLDQEVVSERTRHDEYCQELAAKHTAEMDVLRESSQLEITRLKERLRVTQQEKEKEKPSAVCDRCTHLHDDCKRLKGENHQLTEKLEEMVEMNQKLRGSNALLQGKCETLLEDLSLKEAEWSEREEALQAEIRKQWGERYHQWIVKAEKKMEELQQVNTILQEMLKTKVHNPDLQ